MVLLEDGQIIDVVSDTISLDTFISEQKFVKSAVEVKQNWFGKKVSLINKRVQVKVWVLMAILVLIVGVVTFIVLIFIHWRRLNKNQEEGDKELAKKIQEAVDEGLTLPPTLLVAAERNRLDKKSKVDDDKKTPKLTHYG